MSHEDADLGEEPVEELNTPHHSPRILRLHERLSSLIPCTREDIRIDLRSMSLPDLIFRYLNWADRSVRPTPRRVVTWDGFLRHGSAERHRAAVDVIAEKIEAGEDLTPFLSDRIKTSGYVRAQRDEHNRTRGVEWGDKDYALNAYETHHLHLNSTGTRELLYIQFTRDEAFFVMVGDHNSFDDGSLARAVAEARVGTAYEIKGILGFQREITDRDRNDLQRRGISTLNSTPSGHFVAGGMLTTSGVNMLLAMHGNNWMRAIDELDPKLDDANVGLAWFEGAGLDQPESPHWEYAHHYCDLLLFERSSGLALPIVKWNR